MNTLSPSSPTSASSPSHSSLLPPSAAPRLTDHDLEMLSPLAMCQEYADGDYVFKAGQADLDLFVVESGCIDIQNPTNHNKVIATHEAGAFAGDIDLLTGRPVIVSGVARGRTRVLRVPSTRLREVLNRVPSLSEKLLIAMQTRRQMLEKAGVAGLRVVGPARCKETNVVREFLHKNFVPFTWYDPFDPNKPQDRETYECLGSPKKMPAVEVSDGRLLLNPCLRDLAAATGILRHCPDQTADLAVVGAGPAGIAAAVYAASEGLSTVVFDRLGPGGQAGGSSKIENFIGFPSGLSGTELATRGVLQMLKFGARMIAPISVEKIDVAPAPGAGHTLHLDCGAKILARTILVASGVRWRKLEAEGADRFERAGVFYACTAVEALMYDNADVVVIGGGNSAGQATMYLAECCPNRTVHLSVRSPLEKGMSEYLITRIRSSRNVVVHDGTTVTAVRGGERNIDSVELTESATGRKTSYPAAAVFVFIGAQPACEWLPPDIARDAKGFLLAGAELMKAGKWPLKDREPCPLETSIPGILAGGDVRSGSTKRVGFAVGDGSLAVTCAHHLRSLAIG